MTTQSTEAFTIAVLPDTQFYCDTRLKLSKQWGHGDLRHYFSKQTQWALDHQEELNIVFLLHEGDIVQTDDCEEWDIAKKAMSILDDAIPYCMCLGDHDMGFKRTTANKYGGEKAVNRKTEFNNYFPLEKYSKRNEFGGAFESDCHDNSWYHFKAANMMFLIISLEFHPRNEVLNWANNIVTNHPLHRIIILTHSYLESNQTRTTQEVKLNGNHGEMMWQKLVKKHPNIFMVLCGHHCGEATLTSIGDHGNQVFQILSDYQHLNDGGESWLRYMVFQPNMNTINVHTYNPALDSYMKGPSSCFQLKYSMTEA
mgnify:CR=1 FL=1